LYKKAAIVTKYFALIFEAGGNFEKRSEAEV
jgi:hypothetical protein